MLQIKRNNITVAEVYAKDSSYINEEINGEFIAKIEFDVRNPIDLAINDYIVAGDNTFYLRYQSSITKEETSLGYSYVVTFYHVVYKLHDVIFFMYDEPEFRKNFNKFTGTSLQVLELVIKSMNRKGYNWVVGDCIDSKVVTFDFANKTCAEVINDLIREFNTEYWFEGNALNIGKREYNSNGLVLSQGGGFKNLTLEAVNDTPPITKLYVYGGDTNMTAQDGDYLMLPGGVKYIEKNVDKYGVIESIKQFEDIFPHGEFHVSDKIDTLTFVAEDIDFNLKDSLIDEVEVIVSFQTGGLAGYDLTIDRDKSDFEARKIVLIKNDEETDLEVPGDINFEVGDMFILTGLKMPQSYVENAQKELLGAAQKHLNEICENQVQVRGECDENEFAEREIYVACGQMIGVYNQKLDINREIRTTKVKRYFEYGGYLSYRYDITLSDFLQTNGFSEIVNEIKDVPKKIDKEVNPFKQYTRRNFQDVMETFEMMFDPEGEYFTEKILPLAVQTAQLIVGTNSQQFELVDVLFQPNFNAAYNSFHSTAGQLVHFTINNDNSTRTWNIAAYSTSFGSNNPYYIYAKCDRNGSNGVMYATTDQLQLLSDPNYYYFWIGVVNSPRTVDGYTTRSWQPNFGYTEITGNQITTGVIKDRLARIVINLENGTTYGKMTFAPGSSGYDNITDKPEIPDEIEIKDSLAKSIGYSSYTDMYNKAIGGKSIINGAYIRASLIEAEAIITNALVVTEISNIAGNIINENGIILKKDDNTLSVTPGVLPALSSMLSIGNFSGDINLPTITDTKTSTVNNSKVQWDVRSTERKKVNNVSSFNYSTFNVYAAGSTTYLFGDGVSLDMVIYLEAYNSNGSLLSQKIVAATYNMTNNSKTVTLSVNVVPGSWAVPAGTSSIGLRAVYSLSTQTLAGDIAAYSINAYAVTRPTFSGGQVKKSILALDGYGLVLNDANYLHVKASGQMALSFKGIVTGNSDITGHLLTIQVGPQSGGNATIYTKRGRLANNIGSSISAGNGSITVYHYYGSTAYMVFFTPIQNEGYTYSWNLAAKANDYFTIKFSGFGSGGTANNNLNPTKEIMMLSY